MQVAVFLGLPQVLATFGLTVEPLLAELGLARDLLDDADNILHTRSAAELLALCAARTGCEHIGLLLGRTTRPAHLGLVGTLMENSRDLGSALRNLVLALPLNSRAVLPSFSVSAGMATLGITLAFSAEVGRAYGQDFCMAQGRSLIQALLGVPWSPSEVLLAHAAPQDRRPWQQWFRCAVTFDAATTALVFPEAWLSQRLRGADPQAGLTIKRLLRTEAQSEKEFVLFCRRAIVALLVEHKVSVDSVAEAMGIHRRTLNRRLAAEGTSVQALLAEVRLGVARQLLEDTAMPMSDIADTLNYSETSTFSRQFRGWTGSTPLGWRRERRPQSAD
jgi:AraC-like DNA-binding protein